jgi:hypothetical protein
MMFDAAAGTVSTECGASTAITLPLVLDQWVEIKVFLFLDMDWVQIYYDGTLLDDPAVADHPELGGGYQWSLGMFGSNTTGRVNLAALDLFANSASSIYYDDFSLTPFAFEIIGSGCAGSMAAPQLIGRTHPRIDETFEMEVTNLPQSVAFLALGFNTAQAAHGALPFDLGVVGMPGCYQRVSDDFATFLAGSGNIATYSLAIPNVQGFVGLKFSAQAVALDPAAGNARGAVISDAATIIVGR